MNIVLTRTSLDAFRHQLSVAIPSIKSGHLCEAVAKALGFHSHAAMLSTMEALEEMFPIRELDLHRLEVEVLQKADLPKYDMLEEYSCYYDLFHALEATGIEVLHDPIASHVPSISTTTYGKPPNWRTLPPHSRVVLLLARFAKGIDEHCLRDYCRFEPISNFEHVLASILQHRRHLDPQMVDFLVEYLVETDLHLNRDGEDPTEWAQNIMETYIGRILQLLDAISRTWDAGVDPFSLPPPAPVKRRHDRVVVVKGITRKQDQVGIDDTGSAVKDLPNLVGICELALFLGAETVQAQKSSPLAYSSTIHQAAHCLRYAARSDLGDYIDEVNLNGNDTSTFNTLHYANWKARPAYETVFGSSLLAWL